MRVARALSGFASADRLPERGHACPARAAADSGEPGVV